ncbi:MAG: M14 family zinc carboxypeptidase [Kofleriaceae bacterium]
MRFIRRIGAVDRACNRGDVCAYGKKRYKLMQSVELYPAGGTMMDWMYGEARAQSFTIELRPGPWPDSGRYGFVLPPEQIRPTCDEGLAAVLALRRGQ